MKCTSLDVASGFVQRLIVEGLTFHLYLWCLIHVVRIYLFDQYVVHKEVVKVQTKKSFLDKFGFGCFQISIEICRDVSLSLSSAIGVLVCVWSSLDGCVF